MKIISESVDLGGRTIKFEVGRVADQATSSVLVSCGDTTVLVTMVESGPRADIDYFPLTVEYIERLYAGGRIKGSRWVKREGRPSDDAILTARLIDRSIRPLFPASYKNEIQIVITILSVDGENEPDILGILGASAALAISPVPWNGPIGSVRLGFITPKNGQESHFIVNPADTELAHSDMDLVVSATYDKVHMIEAGAQEVAENIMVQAIIAAKKESRAVIDTIERLAKKVGCKKQAFQESETDAKLFTLLKKDYAKEITKLLDVRAERDQYSQLVEQVIENITTKNSNEYDKKQIISAIECLVKQHVRSEILTKDKRIDGRKLDEIRPISASVGVLPRVHGSTIFSRGQTQALTVATLGAPSMEQLIESPTGEESKRYIHHYNMPPYSVGETGRFGFPRRREVGHGALAERALAAVVPPENKFPYTIRLVSEIMSSNGSTSMASTCGSTLALMDAGVPIKAPVAGISIGLVSDGKVNKLLTDILGLEDFYGDMDFKVAGTKDGITAIQLDVKNDGLTDEIIEKSITAAHGARLVILEKMKAVIAVPREKLSQYAPKVQVIKIPEEKIGGVIGPGGKVIRRIIAETGATVDVSDDGAVTITGVDQKGVEKALQWVDGLTREFVDNEEFEGVIKRMLPFGMFVEVLPGREGLVHVSQMSNEFVKDPADLFEVGQKVKVRVREVDEQGRLNLSMLFGEDAKRAQNARPEGGRRDFGRGGNRDRRDRGRRPFRRDRR